MIEKLGATWRAYLEKRRQYQLERALYKAGGHRDPGHGGFEGEAESAEHVVQRISGNAGSGG